MPRIRITGRKLPTAQVGKEIPNNKKLSDGQWKYINIDGEIVDRESERYKQLLANPGIGYFKNTDLHSRFGTPYKDDVFYSSNSTRPNVTADLASWLEAYDPYGEDIKTDYLANKIKSYPETRNLSPEEQADLYKSAIRRIRFSRGFDPSRPARDQTELLSNNSFLDRVTRGANYVFSDPMYGIKPLQWARDIMWAPGAGAVKVMRNLAGDSPEDFENSVAAKNAMLDISGLSYMPKASQSLAHLLTTKPTLPSGLSPDKWGTAGEAMNTMVEIAAATPIFSTVESSPLKIIATTSKAGRPLTTKLLPDITSKHWWKEGFPKLSGYSKDPATKVGEIGKTVITRAIPYPVNKTFGVATDILSIPSRGLGITANPLLNKYGVGITEGLGGMGHLGRGADIMIDDVIDYLPDFNEQNVEELPGTTYYREPSATYNNLPSSDSLPPLDSAGLRNKYKNIIYGADSTSEYSYGGMIPSKELPHLFSYRAGVPLRKHQFVGETGDNSPFDVNGKVDKRMFDIDNPNMCGPGYKFVSGIGCVEDESYDTKPMYDIEELSKSEPRAEYAKEEIAKARYEADPITNNKPKKPSLADRLEKFNRGVDKYTDIFYGAINPWVQRARQKDWNKKWRERAFDLSVADNTFHGNWDPNTGYFQPNRLGYKNTMYGKYGGSLNDNTMNTIRIKILGGPIREEDEEPIDDMAYGGQLGYGFDLGQRNTYTAMPRTKSDQVTSSIKEVPREMANIEAEKGETIYADMDGDGMEEHYDIPGKRHSEGGTPLNVPDGSFVFSDTKKMAIKDPEDLEKFGLSPRKGGYTPAEIAKKYDINKYKAIAEDPTQDNISKNTAIIMIKNYQKKLAELAIIQERMKGWPQGIPEMVMKVVSPEMLEKLQSEIEELKAGQESEEGMQYDLDGAPINTGGFMEDLPEMEEEPDEYEEEEYAYGGDFDLDSYQGGGQSDWRRKKRILEKMNRLQQKIGTTIGYSKRFEEGDFLIPDTQNQQASGRYGDISDADVEDFKKRHEWYFKNLTAEERARWSDSNPDDVRDFQETYNEQARLAGLDIDYFDPNSNDFDALDGKFGEFTYNAPSLNFNPGTPQPGRFTGYICVNGEIKQQEYTSEAERTAAGAKADKNDASLANCKPIVPGTVPNVPKTPVPFDYMTPDRWKMAQVRGRRINKYLPFIADVPYEPIQFTPEEWRAKAAELQSQAGDMSRTLGAYGSASGLGANLSALQGTAARNLVGAIADVDARNVAGWNAFSGREQARKDSFNALRAANQTERYKGNVIANQQYDNALNKQMEDIVNADTNAWLNRMYLGLENETQKFYSIDPRTGKLIWRQGFGVDDLGQTASTNSYLERAKQIKDCQDAGYTYEQCIGSKQAKFGGSSTNKRTLGEMLFNGYGFPF